MCEFCEEQTTNENPTWERNTDLYMRYKKEASHLISYEQWLEDRELKRIKENKKIQKANEEIQQIIKDELGNE